MRRPPIPNGKTIPPTCPKATIRGKPFFAERGSVVSVEKAQNKDTTRDPKLSKNKYQLHPKIFVAIKGSVESA